VSLCINPRCSNRENDEGADVCVGCGSSLIINARFKIIRSLYDLNRVHPTDIYEALDLVGTWASPPNTVKILKILKTNEARYLRLFNREAKTLQSFNKPFLPKVDIDDYFVAQMCNGLDDLHCLALSKIEGSTMDEWIQSNGRITQEICIDWLRQMCNILQTIHEKGFFHRDIKPHNIMVQPDGQLALIDFGGIREITNTYLSKISRNHDYELTEIYTLGFAAPEQINGAALPQSDFYALGRTMIVAITGKYFHNLPRDPETTELQWQKAARHINKPLIKFIERLLSPSPAMRPQNTQEILFFLTDILPGQIKWSRRWRSKRYRYSTIFLLGILTIFLLDLSRLGLSNYYYDLGTNQSNNGDYASARESLQRSSWFNLNEPAYRALALMCNHIGDTDCAKQSYEAATQVNPGDKNPWYNLAIFYEDQGDLKKAMNTYQKALESQKNEPEILNNLARLYIREGDYSTAEAKIGLAQNALKQDRQEKNITLLATIEKNQAWIYLKQRHYQKAKKILNDAITKNPDLVSSYCLLAQVNEGLNLAAEEEWKKCFFPDKNGVDNPQGSLLPEIYEWRYLRFNRTSLGKDKK
jgi:serine/threonine protein kinase